MKRVTFKGYLKHKDQWNTIIEYTEAPDEMIKLRASALNWIIVSIEKEKEYPEVSISDFFVEE